MGPAPIELWPVGSAGFPQSAHIGPCAARPPRGARIGVKRPCSFTSPILGRTRAGPQDWRFLQPRSTGYTISCMANGLEVHSPNGTRVLDPPDDGLATRVNQLEAFVAQSAPNGNRRPVWPLILTAIGAAIAGALAGYMAGGVVCRMKSAFRP